MDPSQIDLDFDEFKQEQPQTIRQSRSGRTIRSVVRYEPEEDTVFEDDVGYDTELTDDSDEELQNCNEMSDESESYTTDADEDESSDEEELETEAETETVAEQEYLEDAIDWETLTDDAQSGDESDEMDSDDDDDE